MDCTRYSCLVLLPLLILQTNAQYNSVTLPNAPNSGQVQTAHAPMPNIDLQDPIIQGAYGEMNLDKDLFEGDIKLTPMQRDYIEQSQRDNVLQARALLNKESQSHKLWSNKEVPYVIGAGLRSNTIDFIKSAIKEWNDTTCINLRPKTDSDLDYIEFVYEGGCSSYVGRVGGKQTISVGNEMGTTCRHGNIVHEIAHSLGYFHEHSRPDRDDYIEVQWDHIMPGYKKNFEKENLETVDSLGVEYDYGSVMHYGAKFFSEGDHSSKTIRTLHGDHEIGQRIGLSELDIKQAKLLYSCEGDLDDKSTTTNTINSSLRSHVKPKTQTLTSKKSHTKTMSPLKKALKHFISKKSNKVETPKRHRSEKPAAKSKIGRAKDKAAAYDGQFGFNQDWTSSRSSTDAETNAAMDVNKMLSDEALGEENFGKNYFEGDMILSGDQLQYLESMKEGAPPRTTEVASKRALIRDKKFLWPVGVVNYYFDDSVDDQGRENAREAIQHWQEHTCLKFNETKDAKDYILFVFEGGCASRVGRGGGMQKLTIGDPSLRCKRGNIIHEMGHAVGFFHEHSRPDRDDYVSVIKKNIVPSYERNFYKFSTKFIDSRNVPYDYGSIMHYGTEFFSKFPILLPTLVTRDSGKNADGEPPKIGQRVKLSKMDILQANLLYNCDGQRRLTDEQRNELVSDMSDQITPTDNVPCSDTYDQKSCLAIKNMGYCQRFPRTLRDACGITCNMCSVAASPVQALPNYQGKKRAFSKLKQQLKQH